MKIASEFVKTFRTVYNRLRREFPKPKDREFETLPTDATEMLVLGILATNETFSRAKHAVRSLREKMVDYNELRVTPAVELADLLDGSIADPRKASTEIVKTLNAVFNRFDTFDLSELKGKSKGELGKVFEDIPGCPDHARCAMLLFCFEVPAMPLDDRMLEYLQSVKAMPAEADLPTARAFIERQLKTSELPTFYWQLRKAAEQEFKSRRPSKNKKDGD